MLLPVLPASIPHLADDHASWRPLHFTPLSDWSGDVSFGMWDTCEALKAAVRCMGLESHPRRRLSKDEQALISLVNLLERYVICVDVIFCSGIALSLRGCTQTHATLLSSTECLLD